MENKIEIPFGAKDSELLGWEYKIPEGYEGVIEDGVVKIRKAASKSRRMFKNLCDVLNTDYVGYRTFGRFDKFEVLYWIQKQIQMLDDLDTLKIRNNMDYKEKYEALLANIKAHHAKFSDTCNLKKELEECVPELAESEDERIRKAIGAAICGATAKSILEANGTNLPDALAYLDRQKEQKSVEPNDINVKKMIDTYRCTEEYDKDGNRKGTPILCMVRAYEQGIRDVLKIVKQKPADEAEKFFDSAESYNQGFVAGQKKMKEDIEKGFGIGEHSLDYLAGRYAGYEAAKQEQKPEWSEEDEGVMDNLIQHLKVAYSQCDWLDKTINWLKSLRPQNHWRPSDEQIEYLAKAIDTLDEEGDCKTAAVLNELRCDLKKLLK